MSRPLPMKRRRADWYVNAYGPMRRSLIQRQDGVRIGTGISHLTWCRFRDEVAFSRHHQPCCVALKPRYVRTLTEEPRESFTPPCRCTDRSTPYVTRLAQIPQPGETCRLGWHLGAQRTSTPARRRSGHYCCRRSQRWRLGGAPSQKPHAMGHRPWSTSCPTRAASRR